MIRLEDYDYDLPPDRIARHPAERRDESRLLHLSRETGKVTHFHFREIAGLLHRGDLLVVNDSRVIPARIFAQRYPGGGKVEILLVREHEPLLWQALVRPGKKIKVGDRLIIEPDQFEAEVVDYAGRGERLIRFHVAGDWWEALDRYGHTPLPPYILKARKQAGESADDLPEDRERYQTVYAADSGSVAAPTAGLHFTDDLIASLEEDGIEIARVTLHVGPGTFQPLSEEHLSSGQLHEEEYVLPGEVAKKINEARAAGQRIVAVGTTSVRVLESACDVSGQIGEGSGTTRLLIAPGFTFRLADALITNFHLPQSSLMLLVSAFAGREKILNAYREAIDNDYRFYSYGDAMLIE